MNPIETVLKNCTKNSSSEYLYPSKDQLSKISIKKLKKLKIGYGGNFPSRFFLIVPEIRQHCRLHIKIFLPNWKILCSATPEISIKIERKTAM